MSLGAREVQDVAAIVSHLRQGGGRWAVSVRRVCMGTDTLVHLEQG